MANIGMMFAESRRCVRARFPTRPRRGRISTDERIGQRASESLCQQSSAVDGEIPGLERLERNRPPRQVIVCGIRRHLALGLLNARPNALCKFIVERRELDPKDFGGRLSRPVQWDGI